MIKQKSEIGMGAVLIYTSLLNAGASFMWPLNTMYLHEDLHRSLTEAGAVVLIMSICMIIGNYVGGYLFDHWSAYKTAIIASGISLFAITTLIFFHGWPIYAWMLVFLGFGDGVSLTLVNSYATMVKGKSPRYVFNMLYIGLNIGVVIGTAMVGYLLKYGVHIVFIVAMLAYLVLFIMTILLFNVDFSGYDHNRQVKVGFEKAPRHIGMLVAICAMVFSVYASYAIWESVMPVHMTSMGISFEDYSLIWTINGVLIITGQFYVSKLGRKIPLSLQVILGVTIFGTSFLFLPMADHYMFFVFDMIFLTIGEMAGLPDVPAWVDSLATPSQKGKYQAIFNVALSSGRAIGPLIAGSVVESLGYNWLFVGAAVLIYASLIWVWYKHRQMKKAVQE